MTIAVSSSPENDEMVKEHPYTDRRGPQRWTQLLANLTLKRVTSKLFTNEDNAQMHKILGIFSLLSFGYRYLWVYPTTGNLGFTGSTFDHITMLLHFFLSSSSLIFHVISHRLLSRPMIIWEEYRLHAIVFTTRCLSVYIFGILKPFQNSIFEHLTLPVVVLSHHVVADLITKKHGAKDGSTTVRMKGDNSADIKTVLRFYSLYQFGALAAHLVPNSNLADLGFNSLIAIQSSAFLMTLYRKSLITYASHGLWYSLCIFISFFHIIRLCGGITFSIKLSLVYFLRTRMQINKYAIWICFSILSIPQVEQFVKENIMVAAISAVSAGQY